MDMMPTAIAIADGVRSGRVTAAQVVEESLARIAARDPEVNAFTAVLAEEARAEAAALDAGDPRREGPLAGVPVAVKAQLDVAGQVTTHGGRANSRPADADCEVVRRLRAAGAVVVGMTNMPELGQFPFTESARYGMTLNPAAPGRTPGGSSGGSAAAVAAGMVPVAIGTDGGGSIRIPASCCGLVGLKASRGRVSPAPARDSWGTLGIAGPITMTVADQALVHEVVDGNMATDRFTLDAPQVSPSDAMTTPPRPLRVGLLLRTTAPGVVVDAEVAAALEAYAQRLRALGHQVVSIGARIPNQTAAFVPQMYAGMRDVAAGVQHPDLLEARTRTTVARSRVVGSPLAVRRALAEAGRVTAAVDAVLDDVDLLLTPTLACRPRPLGQLDAVGPGVATTRAVPMVAFTSIFNVSGHPAMSVPAGTAGDGTPVGAQLVARMGREDLLYALAAQAAR